MALQDINWKEIDVALKRLSLSGKRRPASSVPRSTKTKCNIHQELLDMANMLCGKLRSSEASLSEVKQELARAVKLAEKSQRHSAAHGDMPDEVRELRKSVAALKERLHQKDQRLHTCHADLASSKALHMADIRSAKDAFELQDEHIAKAEAEARRLRAQLNAEQAKSQSLASQLRVQHQATLEEAMQEMKASAAGTESLRRMYEEAKHAKQRAENEAKELARLLCQETSSGKKCREQEASARACLSQEWALCPGGLAFAGMKGQTIDQQVQLVSKTVRTGGGFAKMIDVQKGGVFVWEEDSWVPARALDVMTNFRKCFCPNASPEAFDMLCSVLNRVYKAREAAKITDLQKQHAKQISDMQRKAGNKNSLIAVQQVQKIAALKREVRKLHQSSNLRLKPRFRAGGKAMHPGRIKGGNAATEYDAAAVMESSLIMQRRLEALTEENVNLRSAVRKASTGLDRAEEIHHDGAMAQSEQIQRCISKARRAIKTHIDDACESLELTARQHASRRLSDGVSVACAKLCDRVALSLDDLAADAQLYKAPKWKEAGWAFLADSSDED